VNDLVLVLAGDCARYRNVAAAIGADQPAGVARLATRGRVEDRAVEHDAAAIVDAHDRGFGFAKIGVIAEQGSRLGHHATAW